MTLIDADLPLPDDIDAAHRLIRELIATLRQQTHLNDKLQHQLEQLLRRLYGRKAEKLDPNQFLLFARAILEAAGPGTPELEPTPEPTAPSPAETPGPRSRPQALAGESAPQADRPRRPDRAAGLPRVWRRSRVHR